MPELLEHLNDVTEQRKRLLRCVNLDGVSRDELRILRGDLQRVKLEHQDRKSRLKSSPDGMSIRSGDAKEPRSAAERAARMKALTDSYIAYYQQSLEAHAERERGRLGRVHARHQADHASLQTLIERLNVSEAEIREVMQALEQKAVKNVASDSQNKGAEQLEIARAILLGQPHDRKHYRTATVSALRKLGATCSGDFESQGLAASLA
ncbi:hypothetical protein COCOBI_12-2110 [Coccomyxa sp. Obi]|nr:hypothetical protein COCOBI_12-2110 [Coccomyxa sp. Obi]